MKFMNIKINPNDEDTSYSASVATPLELFNLLADNDLLQDKLNFEVPKATLWFDNLQAGCLVLSPKELKCSIQPQVVPMKKIKFSQEYIYEDRSMVEERSYPKSFSTEQIEADFKEWCNAAIESEWIEVQDTQ